MQSGDSGQGSGGDVALAAGRSVAEGEAGGSVRLAGGAGQAGVGGGVTLQPGAGEAGAGRVDLRDGAGSSRLTVGGDGSVEASSAAGQPIAVSSGAGVSVQSSGADGETLIGHHAEQDAEARVSMRVSDERVVSHVPAQLAGVAAPADARITALDPEAPLVDADSVLQRAMSVPIQTFTYSEDWRRISGLGKESVRAMIGQQVAELMPEWVTVMDELSFPEQGFALQQFHEVNDRQVLYDTLLSLQEIGRAHV